MGIGRKLSSISPGGWSNYRRRSSISRVNDQERTDEATAAQPPARVSLMVSQVRESKTDVFSTIPTRSVA